MPRTRRVCELVAMIAALWLIFMVAKTSANARQSVGASQNAPASQSGNKQAASAAKKPAPTAATSTAPAAQAKPAAKSGDPNTVECHALETHEDAQPAITVVVFNQRDKDDHVRLSDLLKENEGATVSVKTEDGKWHSACVVRLKSCFGRGMLFLSGEGAQIKERENFALRFPAKKAL
jgi:hypothetical protein